MMGSLRRINAVVLRNLYLLRGGIGRILPMFIWVAVDVILWGFLTRFLNTTADSSMHFVPALLGAVLLWDFLVRVSQGVTMAYLEDSWSRNFINLFASPLSVGEYLAGLVATSILTSLIGVSVMLVLAGAFFDLHLLGFGAALVPFTAILFLCGIALGIFGAGMVLRYGPSAEWLVWPLPAIVSPFVGVFYPLTVLPPWMRAVSKVLPPSYVFQNVRTIAAGHPADLGDLLPGLGLSVFYIGLAVWFFVCVYRYVLRHGLAVRNSVESF